MQYVLNNILTVSILNVEIRFGKYTKMFRRMCMYINKFLEKSLLGLVDTNWFDLRS